MSGGPPRCPGRERRRSGSGPGCASTVSAASHSSSARIRPAAAVSRSAFGSPIFACRFPDLCPMLPGGLPVRAPVVPALWTGRALSPPGQETRGLVQSDEARESHEEDGCEHAAQRCPAHSSRASRTRKATTSGACPVVCPAKAGLLSGGQSHRGNNQEPRSLDSREEGNRISEAYRQCLPWGDSESSGRNASERTGGLESAHSEGRAHNRRAKAAWTVES